MMRKGFGLGGVALLSVVCCAGLPLIVAAGLSVAAFAWIGGIAVGIAAIAAAAALLIIRARRRRLGVASCSTPSPTSTKETTNGARLLRARRTEHRDYPRNG